jgi:hypothetical protein
MPAEVALVSDTALSEPPAAVKLLLTGAVLPAAEVRDLQGGAGGGSHVWGRSDTEYRTVPDVPAVAVAAAVLESAVAAGQALGARLDLDVKEGGAVAEPADIPAPRAPGRCALLARTRVAPGGA